MVIRNQRSAPPMPRARLVDVFFLQMLIVAVLADFGPLAIAYANAGADIIATATVTNTQIASVIAALAALIGVRRLSAYPGTRGFAYILPVFCGLYGLAGVALLVLRVAYSGSMLIMGLVLTVTAMFVLRGFAQRGAPMQFYIVPGSEGAIVRDTPRVEWVRLDKPEVPSDPNAIIVADLAADYSPAWERMLATAAINGRTVYHTKQLRESLTGRVQIEHLSENNFGSLVPNHAYAGVKRVLDIVVAAIALPVLALPLLVAIIAIRLDSPGPVIFRQVRMGYRGQLFRVLKLRTMRHGPADAGDRDSAITRSADDRITRVGRFLRRSRLDEIPQLVNVLRGDMSLIGPRPEAVSLSGWYERELPFYSYRHIVRPGITGWAQINQGHVAGLDDVLVKLHYDFYYIKNFSAWIDILIAMRTVVTMVSGYGSK